MDAGKLTERITFKREARTEDGYGGATVAESAVLSCWAMAKPLSGRERDQSDQTESPRNYRFTIRRSSDSAGILASDTIVWRSKRFNIRFIADAGAMPHYMEIDAQEGVAT